jgi:hypothetical protein
MTRGKGKDEVKSYPLSLNPLHIGKKVWKQVRSYEICNNKPYSMYYNCSHCCNNRYYEKKIVCIIDSKKQAKCCLFF